MATVEGLNLRGARFYLRVLIPQDLQEAYEGRTRVNLSLRTNDRATAVLHGLRVKAQWLEEFAAIRQGQLQPQTGSTTAEALLAQGNGIYLAIGEGEYKAIEPHSEPQQESNTLAAPPQQNASQRPAKGLVARSHVLDSQAPLQPRQKPTRIRNAPNKGLSMWEVYEQWKKAERRAKDNEQAYARTLTLAEKCLDAPLHIGAITRAHGNTFKAWLLAPEQGYAPKTCKNHFTNFQSLLRFAHLELEAIPQNPWQGLYIKVPKVITRRPWRDEELHTLFSQPLFQKYELPESSRGGGAAAYWIPLIGLFTGARIGELAQLRTSDITYEDGVPVINITDAGDGQKLKTSASRRSIPIHSELLRLGLLKYVADVRSAKPPLSDLPPDSLWPELGSCSERQSNQISSWFSSYRKKIGLTDIYPDFHCLRHTARTKMAKAKIPEQVMDAITGHETGGSTGRKVYQHLEVSDLTAAMQSLSYQALSLPVAYTQFRQGMN